MTFGTINTYVYKILIALLVISFPYHIRVSAVLTLLLATSWIFKVGYKGLVDALKNKVVIIFILLFIISVISLSYSEDKDLYHIDKKLSLLAFSLILFRNGLSNQQLRLIFWLFILSCGIASIYSLFNVIVRQPELWRARTEITTEALDISHVYFGLYLSFAIVLLVYLLMTDSVKRIYVSIIIFLLVALFLFIMFLIGGKMAIISLFLLAIITGIIIIVRTRRRIVGWGILTSTIVIICLVFVGSDNVRSRFSNLFNKEHYYIGDNSWTNIGVRLTAFNCACEVFANSSLIGTGLGDVQHDLNNCYKENGFLTVIDTNAHNQYIQTSLGSGVIGLLCLLFVLGYPSINAFREKNYLYLCFIFLFAMCCLTESLLERQQGVMFYAFFNAILFYNFKTQDTFINKEGDELVS